MQQMPDASQMTGRSRSEKLRAADSIFSTGPENFPLGEENLKRSEEDESRKKFQDQARIFGFGNDQIRQKSESSDPEEFSDDVPEELRNQNKDLLPEERIAQNLRNPTYKGASKSQNPIFEKLELDGNDEVDDKTLLDT